jgi:ABC-type multidrug transport system ATPase subunit
MTTLTRLCARFRRRAIRFRLIALLGRPELLVPDEPTVGLTPSCADLWNTFHELAAGNDAALQLT